MRWKWILPRFIVVAMLVGFLQFGVDPLLQYAGVHSLQAITGAKVDINSISTSFFPPSARIDGLALASRSRPGKNILELNQLSFRLEPHSLSRRRFVVQDARMEGLQFDTVRNDDGQLPFQQVPEETEPSWLAEKLADASHDWLQEMESTAFEQLDPNQLQTWRLGKTLYQEWDTRFQELSGEARGLEPRVKNLRDQFRRLRELPPIEQIEQGVRLAQSTDQLLRDVENLNQQLRQIAPRLRSDVEGLDNARKSDQELVKNKIAAFHPDAGFLSRTLLGRDLYLHIAQLLSWVETFSEYQSGLEDQLRPGRGDGRWLAVLPEQPSPDFHLQNLAFSGIMSIRKEPVAWHGTLTDLSSDSLLLGQPTILQAAATGSNEIRLTITSDPTAEDGTTSIVASWLDHDGFSIAAGRPEQLQLRVALEEPRWDLNLQLGSESLKGFLSLNTNVHDVSVDSEGSVRPELLQATRTALASVSQFRAAAAISGELKKPRVELSSDLGHQLAGGMKKAFADQFETAKTAMLASIDRKAIGFLDQLKSRCESEYTRLSKENTELLDQLREVQTLTAALSSPGGNPGLLLKQVSQSKLLSERDRSRLQKVDGTLDQFKQKLNLNTKGVLLGAPLAPPASVPRATDPLALPGLLPGNLPQLLQKSGTSSSTEKKPGIEMLPEIIPGLKWDR